MDELLSDLDQADKLSQWNPMPFRADLVSDAARALRASAVALRASAEREKELVEALEKIKADSDAFYGGHNLWDGGYESGLEHCAEIARAILDKHKEKV